MDSSIFPLPVIRGLTDRLYDKRKAAALEIEKLARENAKSSERITQIIDTLVQDFVYSNNPNARNGGLIGLAATAIALGSVRLSIQFNSLFIVPLHMLISVSRFSQRPSLHTSISSLLLSCPVLPTRILVWDIMHARACTTLQRLQKVTFYVILIASLTACAR
jgi:hypothetical protein